MEPASGPVDFLIITPLTEEREAVLRRLGRVRRLSASTDDTRIYYAATVRSKAQSVTPQSLRLIVAQPVGMGRVEAATLAKDAIQRFRPRFVLIVGIAGGLGKDVALGDLLIADSLVDYELQKVTEKRTDLRYVTYEVHTRLLQVAQHLNGWQRLLKHARPVSGEVAVHFGPMACGDKVIASQKRLAPIRKSWPKLIGIEMEGSGVAAAVKTVEPPPGLLMIRGVSDLANAAKGTPDVEKWRTYACEAAAAFTVALLRSGLVPATALPPVKTVQQAPDGALKPGPPPAPLLDGIAPLSVATAMRAFLKYYLGDEACPAPFGGREATIAMLDHWLAEPQPACLLLTAPAGRGKSAVLAQWANQLVRRDNLSVAYYPISLRFCTQQATHILSALCSRLARIHGDTASSVGSGMTYSELRDLFSHLLSRPLPPDLQLVLILDGLDEAAELELTPALLPTDNPALKIVVSAREGAAGRQAEDYCYQLGWGGSQARRESLPPLQRLEDLESILNSVGIQFVPRSGRARGKVLRKLLELSEGDPLLVRFLVEELKQHRVSLSGLPDYLDRLHPGFDGLIDRWWAEQTKSAEKRALEEYQRLFDVLAAAYGALQRTDLQELVAAELPTGAQLDRALAALGRFLVPDASSGGLVFTHSKLRDYFWDRLSLQEQAALDARFVRYGQRVLNELQHGQRQPQAVPLYLLHHLGAHLARSQQPLASRLALVTKVWYEASVAAGSDIGYLSDVCRTMEAAAVLNQRATDSKQQPTHLLDELRCALVAASLRSRAGNVSAELLEELLARGKWSPAQALAHLRQEDPLTDTSHEAERAAASLTVLAPCLSRDLLREAVELAELYRSRKFSAREPLAVLIPRLLQVDPEYLMATLSGFPAWDRVHFHLRAFQHAQEPHKSSHLTEAEQAASELSAYPSAQSAEYQRIAKYAPADRERLLALALSAAKEMPELDHRFYGLCHLYKEWPDARVDSALREIIALVKENRFSVDVLSRFLFDSDGLAEMLVDSLIHAMADATGAPKALCDVYASWNISVAHRQRLLWLVAEHWPPLPLQSLYNLVLSKVATATWPNDLDHSLGMMLRLTQPDQKTLALASISLLKEPLTRAYAKALAAEYLPSADLLPALRDAVALLPQADWQKQAFATIFPLLPDHQQSVAIMIILSDAHPLLREEIATLLAGDGEVHDAARAVLDTIASQARAELATEVPDWKQFLKDFVVLFPKDVVTARALLAQAIRQGEFSEGATRVAHELERIIRYAVDSKLDQEVLRELWPLLQRYYEKEQLRLTSSDLCEYLQALPQDLYPTCVEFALRWARQHHDEELLLCLRKKARGVEPDALLNEALDIARRIDDRYVQLTFYIAVADTSQTQQELLSELAEGVLEKPLPFMVAIFLPRVLPELRSALLAAAVVEIDKLPGDGPDRLRWTATLAKDLSDDLRQPLVQRAWSIALQFFAENRETLAIHCDGLFPRETPTHRMEQMRTLAEPLAMLGPYLTPSQVMDALNRLPTRSAYGWSRVRLIAALPEPTRSNLLGAEYERACGRPLQNRNRIGMMATVAAMMSGTDRDVAIDKTLHAIEQMKDADGSHSGMLHHLRTMAPGLRACDEARVGALLLSAARETQVCTSFPALLQALPEPLRRACGQQLFAFSESLPVIRQDRLRAHLVTAVSGNQLELALSCAVRCPEQSVLSSIPAIVAELASPQLLRFTRELAALQNKDNSGVELLGALNALLLEQRRRELSWQAVGYQVWHRTLAQRTRKRGELLQMLSALGPIITAMVSSTGGSAEQIISVLREVCGWWP